MIFPEMELLALKGWERCAPRDMSRYWLKQPIIFLPKAVLGTRKPLIVNLSVPAGTDKIYRGVR
jgi:hypothetical protein